MQQVEECSAVTIEYTLRTISPDGTVMEALGQTSCFVYGVDAQYPSVESALRDRKVGERVQVRVPAEEIFGCYDEELVRELPREDYRQERLKAGTDGGENDHGKTSRASLPRGNRRPSSAHW